MRSKRFAEPPIRMTWSWSPGRRSWSRSCAVGGSSKKSFLSGGDRGSLDLRGARFAWGTRTYVMGIINVTPDSFSGDGTGADEERAVSQGVRMVSERADMLDVGGESTRPGHQPITAAEEIARTEDVVARLVRETDVPVSIDT